MFSCRFRVQPRTRVIWDGRLLPAIAISPERTEFRPWPFGSAGVVPIGHASHARAGPPLAPGVLDRILSGRSIDPRGPLFDTPTQGRLRKVLDAMVRVDLAGEQGAIRIYDGQLSQLTPGTPAYHAVAAMRAGEEPHLASFRRLARGLHVRPTLLHPIWSILGYGLGAVTAYLGPEAAMACTVGVEEVIGEHYAQQVAALRGLTGQAAPTVTETGNPADSEGITDAPWGGADDGSLGPGGTLPQDASERQPDDLRALTTLLAHYRDDELAHRDEALQHGAEQVWSFPLPNTRSPILPLHPEWVVGHATYDQKMMAVRIAFVCLRVRMQSLW